MNLKDQKGIALIPAILIIAGVLVLAGGVYYGSTRLTTGWQKTSAPAATPAVSPTSTPSTSDQTANGSTTLTTNQAGTVEKQIGYIKNVYEKGEKRYLDIDYIQWFLGDEAIKAEQEDGKCPTPDLNTECAPDGYYIRNQNPQIRTFEISPQAEILTLTYVSSANTVLDEKTSYEVFKKSFWGASPAYTNSRLFHIEIKNGMITKIEEQFMP